MRRYILLYLLAAIAALAALSGCAAEPRTLKDSTRDDLYPILTEEQSDSLEVCATEESVNRFLEAFWQQVDSASGLPPGDLKAEYLQRLAYANDQFPDRRGTGRSDRKRIYLMYGPPDDIERFESTNAHLGEFTRMKSVEIWLYFEPGTRGPFPSVGDAFYPGMKKFIFGDLAGFGVYRLLYSSEEGGQIDSQWYDLN